MLKIVLLVFVGGGIGSVLRLGVYHLARLWTAAAAPWGTLAVNVIGGLAAGLVAGLMLARQSGGEASPAYLFLMTGLLGGFTTFSAFSLDAVLLWQKGQPGAAAAYVLGSVILAIAGVLAGMGAARLLT